MIQYRMKAKGITYMSMVEELPITLKNSHLTQLLLAEMRYDKAEKPAPPTALEIAPRYISFDNLFTRSTSLQRLIV